MDFKNFDVKCVFGILVSRTMEFMYCNVWCILNYLKLGMWTFIIWHWDETCPQHWNYQDILMIPYLSASSHLPQSSLLTISLRLEFDIHFWTIALTLLCTIRFSEWTLNSLPEVPLATLFSKFRSPSRQLHEHSFHDTLVSHRLYETSRRLIIRGVFSVVLIQKKKLKILAGMVWFRKF